jgi:hypothetical protein
MKCLNEPIARQANREDRCTGHFWESRFKSQALLSEESLLSCMAYVDLNPIRAAMAETPETSDHTSIKERISPSFDLETALESQEDIEGLQHFDLPIKPLLKFEGTVRQTEQAGILFDIKDYLQLVDTTGRIVREDKRGAIPSHLPPILDRLSLSFEEWLSNATQFELIYQSRFKRRRLAS